MVAQIAENPDPNVIPALLRARKNARLSLHVLHYKSGATIAALRLRLRLPGLRAGSGGKLLGLEGRDGEPIALKQEGDAVVFELPSFRKYVGVAFA
ncbi:MAG: hypothetical protein PHR35_07195 [Kiritimatiellae bacterium]|nr:hypothetical protein [Kiritimatiellia bacterium]